MDGNTRTPMKRSELLLIAALTGTAAGAQISIGNRVGAGLFHQVMNADGDVEDFWTEDQVKLIAPTVTVPVEVRLSDRFALQPELGFTQRGSGNQADYGTSTFQVNGIEFSLLAKGFVNVGKWRPYVLAGPSIDRSLSVRSSFEPSANSTMGPAQESVVSADDYPLEVAQLAATAGLGAAMRIGVPWLFLDYRHLWGLTPLMRIDLVDANMNVRKEARIYDRGSILAIGIMIPLNRGAWETSVVAPQGPASPQN